MMETNKPEGGTTCIAKQLNPVAPENYVKFQL